MKKTLVILCAQSERKKFLFLKDNYNLFFLDSEKLDISIFENFDAIVPIVEEDRDVEKTFEIIRALKNITSVSKIILVIKNKKNIETYIKDHSIEIFLQDIPIKNLVFYIERIFRKDRPVQVEDIIDRLILGWDIFSDFFKNLELPYLETIPYLFILHSKDKRILYINKYAKKILGDVIGLSSWSIYSSSLTGAKDCPLDLSLRTKNTSKSRSTLLSKDGKMRRVMVLDIPIFIQNRVQYVAEYCLDIDEIFNIHEKILSSELKFQQLFEEVPCYIFLFDKTHKIISINKKFKQDFGNRIGYFCYNLYNRDTPCENCPLEDIKKYNKPQKCENIIINKDGEKKYVLIWIAPIIDSSGHIKEFMEILTDVTEIKNIQRHLVHLGIFLSSVSHEIKNMFTAIDANLYKINRAIDSLNIKDIKNIYSKLDKLFFRIKRLVIDILDYAKQRDLEFKRINITYLINYINDIVNPKIQKDIEFKIYLPKKDFYLYIDEQKLLSALINIIDNAVDACIEDTSKPNHKVQLIVRRIKNKAIFRVIDNGIGMDKDTINHIFEPFFSSKGSRGTGLGLFIANDIIKRHGGKVYINSSPGKGTEFTIELPIFFLSSHK